MYYLTQLDSGVVQIGFEPPEDGTLYTTCEELPSGEGAIHIGEDGKPYRKPPLTSIKHEEGSEEPTTEENELWSQLAESIREGVNEV